MNINLKPIIYEYRIITITIVLGIFLALGIFILQNASSYELPEEVAKINIISSAEPDVVVKYSNPHLTYVNTSPSFITSNLPKDLMIPVYEYTESDFFTDDKLKQLYTHFGTTEIRETNSPIQGYVITALTEDGKRALTIERSREVVYFSQDNTEQFNTRFATDITEEKILDVTNKFINEFPINPGKFAFSDIQYMYGPAYSSPTPVTKLDQANHVIVNYYAKNNEYDVISKGETLYPNLFRVTINSKLQVISAYVEPVGIINDEKYKVKVIDINKNNSIINASTFKLIDTTQLNPKIKPTSVLVTEGKLAYYEINGLLLPVFIVKGEAILTSEESVGLRRNENIVKGIVDAIDRSTQ